MSIGELLQLYSNPEWEVDLTDEVLDSAVEFSVEYEDNDDEWAASYEDMLRESCAFFASEMLQGPPQPPYNGRFLISDHHQEWDDLVVEHERLCILAPRDHGKTFFFDFAYPIWKAAYKPGGKGYIFSATQDQAVRILEDIKEEIESNPKLQFLNPANKSKNWSKTQITLANGHKIYARGYGTKIRGAHPDWIVIDDGLNDEDAYSELVRQKHIDYFYTAITNMIVPGGQIIVVGTPFHAADLYADLEKNETYYFKKYPAVDKKTGAALWPERYCASEAGRLSLKDSGIIVESLEKRSREIGSVRFTREFMCEPISDEMSLFPEKLFRGSPTEQLLVCMGQKRSYYAGIGITSFYVGVDFAISASTSADYTVVFVMGVDANGNRWVVDILRHKGLGYQQQISLIHAVSMKYDPDIIFLESNQMQRIFGDELIRTSGLPIHKFITTGSGKKTVKHPSGNTITQNKNSLEGGVPALRVLLENGKFRIPRGDAESVEKSEIWIQEMKHFTWLEGKLQGVGSHDDCVMACWICDQAVKRGGFKFSTGDEDDLEGLDFDAFLAEQTGEDEEEVEDGEAQLDDVVDPVHALEAAFAEGKNLLAPGQAPSLLDEEEALDPLGAAWQGLPGLTKGFGE